MKQIASVRVLRFGTIILLYWFSNLKASYPIILMVGSIDHPHFASHWCDLSHWTLPIKICFVGLRSRYFSQLGGAVNSWTGRSLFSSLSNHQFLCDLLETRNWWLVPQWGTNYWSIYYLLLTVPEARRARWTRAHFLLARYREGETSTGEYRGMRTTERTGDVRLS